MLVNLLWFALTSAALAQEPTRFLRYPDVHGDDLVFSYAGDLWRVEASGGEARRLTSHQGTEYLSRISPDGRSIAFSAEYDGNMDVYIMPAEGGEPRRLTFHEAVGGSRQRVDE